MWVLEPYSIACIYLRIWDSTNTCWLAGSSCDLGLNYQYPKIHFYDRGLKMLNVDVIGNKKRKRCGKVFRFKNFGEPGYPVEFTGPFRENVNALLEFANLESKLGFGMPMWSFQLEVHRHPPSHIFLLVIEEATEASMNRHCKHCQYVGNYLFFIYLVLISNLELIMCMKQYV